MLRKYTGTWISTWSGNINDPWHPLTHPGSVPSTGRLTYYNSLLIVHQQEAVFQPRSAGSWRLFWFPSLVSWYPEAVLVTQPRQLVAGGCSGSPASSAGSWWLFWFPSLVSWRLFWVPRLVSGQREAVLVPQPRQLAAGGCSGSPASSAGSWSLFLRSLASALRTARLLKGRPGCVLFLGESGSPAKIKEWKKIQIRISFLGGYRYHRYLNFKGFRLWSYF